MRDLLQVMFQDGFLSYKETLALRKTCTHLNENPVRVLRSLNIASPKQVQVYLQKFFGIELVSDEIADDMDNSVSGLIPKEIALHLSVFPVAEEGETLYVGMEDPLDKGTIRKLEFFLGRRIKAVSATVFQIAEVLQRLYQVEFSELKLASVLEDSRGIIGGIPLEVQRFADLELLRQQSLRERKPQRQLQPEKVYETVFGKEPPRAKNSNAPSFDRNPLPLSDIQRDFAIETERSETNSDDLNGDFSSNDADDDTDFSDAFAAKPSAPKPPTEEDIFSFAEDDSDDIPVTVEFEDDADEKDEDDFDEEEDEPATSSPSHVSLLELDSMGEEEQHGGEQLDDELMEMVSGSEKPLANELENLDSPLEVEPQESPEVDFEDDDWSLKAIASEEEGLTADLEVEEPGLGILDETEPLDEVLELESTEIESAEFEPTAPPVIPPEYIAELAACVNSALLRISQLQTQEEALVILNEKLKGLGEVRRGSDECLEFVGEGYILRLSNEKLASADDPLQRAMGPAVRRIFRMKVAG